MMLENHQDDEEKEHWTTFCQNALNLVIQWHFRDGVSDDWSQTCYMAGDGHLLLILLPHLLPKC